jgi:Protein of unknown function (DUF2939)
MTSDAPIITEPPTEKPPTEIPIAGTPTTDAPRPWLWVARHRKSLMATPLILAALFYAWPMWSAYQLRQGVRNGDSAVLSARVDFPQLRENLKATIGTNLKTAESGWWIRRKATQTLGPFLAARSIDVMVTPTLLAFFLKHQMSANEPGKKPVASADQEDPDPLSPRRLRWAFFESPTRFRIETADRDKPGRRLVAILSWQGITWRLTNAFYVTPQ